ncbi:MAG TPA: arabinofuranosyltransferase [Propionibacteriaceae bacterium]|nr:arabinofuranosyltransferase [Propionibacteriaceae bacterium]
MSHDVPVLPLAALNTPLGPPSEAFARPVTGDSSVPTLGSDAGRGPVPPTAKPAPSASVGLRRVVLLLPWVGFPLAVAGVYALLPPVTELRSQYQASGLVLASAASLAWLLTRRSPLAHHAAAALAACVLPSLALLSLRGAGWYFAAPIGDQAFRLEYAARFASDLGSLNDYTYRDISAFYSPGYFWLVGLASQVTGLPAWHAYKWVSVAALFAAAAVAFWLWHRSVGTRLSALLVAVTVVGLPSAGAAWLGSTATLLHAGAYEPYGWYVALSLPALLTWWARARGRFDARRGLLLGLALAAAAWSYSLYAGVAVLAVLIVAFWRGAGRGRWGEVFLAGLTSMLLVLPWLGPFVVAFVAAGMPPVLATTYYVNGASSVHLVTPQSAPWLIVALAGGVALLGLGGERHRGLRGCQALLLTVLLLGVLQLVAGQMGRGVLFHRVLLILGVTLLAGGTLAVAEYGPRISLLLQRALPGLRWRRVAAAGLAVALFIGLSGHAREWMDRDRVFRGPAHDRPAPDGRLSPLATVNARENAAKQPTLEETATAITRVSREAGQPEFSVVLTDHRDLLATTPLFSYLQWEELYSNPLADYPRRQAFVENLADADPDDVVPILRAEVDGPTVFVLRLQGDYVTFHSSGYEPEVPRSTEWSVELPAKTFESSDFVTTRVGDWLVAALRTE